MGERWRLGQRCVCPPPEPDPSRCSGPNGHPPVSELVSIWCRDCQTYKVDGVTLPFEGKASLLEILGKIPNQKPSN